MANINYYGIEGKNEANEIKQFNQQFLSLRNDYTVVNICGVQSFSRSSRELDLICVIHKEYRGNETSTFQAFEDYPSKKKIGKDEFQDLKKGDKFKLSNTLIFMVEIKNHSKENISIRGSDIYVKYNNKDTLISDKFISQAKVANEKILQHSPTLSKQTPLNVISLVYFPNAKKSDFDLKDREVRYGILFNDSNFQDLIKCALFHQGTYQKETGYQYSLLGKRIENFGHFIDDLEKYYREMRPSRLEQDRLELIAKKFATKDKQWVKQISNNPIVFTGLAGTGKTLKLIRLANDMLEDYNTVLFLTFNRALARDLQRLTELQRLASAKSITVWTIYKFLFELARRFNLYEKTEFNFNDESKDVFKEIRDLILIGLEDDTILNKIRSSLFRDYEYVAIDEAQDWLTEERDIIIKIFGPEKIFLAVGTDQCMRSSRLANWKGDFLRLKFKPEIINDNISLRLTSNLARFNNHLAENLNLTWGVGENQEILGGSIVLFNNATKEIYQNFLSELFSNNQYHPIDFLVIAKSKNSYLSQQTIKELGFNFWNGISDEDRNQMIGINQVRGVSLESARGLEGWSVLVLDVDYWWKWCIFQWRRLTMEDDSQLQFLHINEFDDINDSDLADLPSWFLIPFTRAKNKLLIQLPNEGRIRNVFLDLYQKNPDYVQYINN